MAKKHLAVILAGDRTYEEIIGTEGQIRVRIGQIEHDHPNLAGTLEWECDITCNCGGK